MGLWFRIHSLLGGHSEEGQEQKWQAATLFPPFPIRVFFVAKYPTVTIFLFVTIGDFAT